MNEKIDKLLARFKECEAALGDPNIYADQKKFKALTQEHAYLGEVKSTWERLQGLQSSLFENKELLREEKDTEFADLLKEEINSCELQVQSLQEKLESLLVPPDPNDSRTTIVELRAGTGGDEAALFVGDMVRMYQYYATKMGWKIETMSTAPSEIGGFKEYVMVMSGTNVYRHMQYEAGTHRVQRVPATEAQGRVHTSAITVAVLLEPDEEEEVEIDEKELRIDTFRSSGAGGQHVNKTDSAVRLTHMPTGIVVECQEERSQHKNKDKALRYLKTKIADMQRAKVQASMANERSQQVGSGDRSERIRTYNFPQNRVTDHRINLTLYNLSNIMEGEMGPLTNGLISHFHEQKLNAQ